MAGNGTRIQYHLCPYCGKKKVYQVREIHAGGMYECTNCGTWGFSLEQLTQNAAKKRERKGERQD